MTRLCTILVLLLTGAVLGGCPKIDGGAVEVAWVVRRSNGSSSACMPDWQQREYRIDRLRLRVIPEDDPGMDLCASADSLSICEFSCEAGGGATAFDIPAGTYFFDLVPLSSDGTVIPSSVVALPAPLRRTIVEGDITDLGIWQLVFLNDEP